MKTIPLSKGLVALVSDCDYSAVSQYSWCAGCKKDKPYAVGRVNGKLTLMHKFVAKRAGWLLSRVDHRNGNRLNNTRRNLRPATNQQNQRNRRGPVLAKSGVRGVYPNTNNRWQARIAVDGKMIGLGTFDTITEAARTRRRAEARLFKEFAPSSGT